MTPQQHALAKKIFLQAIELKANEVSSYINTQTSDQQVINQVLELVITYQSNTQYTNDFVSDIAENISKSPLLFPSERYTLIKKIGQGGMGDVYLAQRKIKNIKQKVAIKILQLSDNLSKRQFSQETSILSQLSHPNISQFIDADFLSDGRPYVVMEYAEGKTITDYCQTNNLDIKARLVLFTSLCKAVEHAHRNLVIHRDIKPENILVNEQGKLMLLDFGIAKIIQESDNQTKTQMHAMTPAYASPEQFVGKAVSVSSDVYSLGVLLYELLTGARPYEPKNHSPIEFEKLLKQSNPIKPSAKILGSQSNFITNNKKSWAKRLSGDLDKIIIKSLQYDVIQRYQTVAKFIDDLERYKNKLPILAHKPSLIYHVGKFASRNKLLVVSILIFIIFILFTIQQKISLNNLSNELSLRKEELKIKEKEVARDQQVAINIAHTLSTKHYTDFDNLGKQNLIIDNTINIATGNLYYNLPIDLLSDSIPFAVTYNSALAMQTRVKNNYRPLQSYNLGKGWNHNYSNKIDHTSVWSSNDNKVVKVMLFYRPDGRTVRFKEIGDKWVNISFTKETLTKDGKDWLLIDNENHEYYTPSGQLKKISTNIYTINLKYERGKLLSDPFFKNKKSMFLSDPFSRFNDSFYNVTSRLKSIISDNGEQINFHYINNKTQITKITNHFGHSWKFGYDLFDNLTTISFPDRSRKIFEYKNDDFSNLISQTIDFSSRGAYSNRVEFQYGPFHRIILITNFRTGCEYETLFIIYNNDYTRTVRNRKKSINTYWVDKIDKIWEISSEEINFEYHLCNKPLNNN